MRGKKRINFKALILGIAVSTVIVTVVTFREPVVRLNPFYSIKIIYHQGGVRSLIYKLGGNFLLLMPMGFFISYYLSNIFNSLKRVFIAMFLISLFIESTQVVLSLIVPNIYRFFEINDLILNSIGGVLWWKLYCKLFKRESRVVPLDCECKNRTILAKELSKVETAIKNITENMGN